MAAYAVNTTGAIERKLRFGASRRRGSRRGRGTFGSNDRPVPSVPPKVRIMDHPAPKLDGASFIRILFLDRYRAVRYRTLSLQNGHPLVQQGRVPDLDQGVMNV